MLVEVNGYRSIASKALVTWPARDWSSMNKLQRGGCRIHEIDDDDLRYLRRFVFPAYFSTSRLGRSGDQTWGWAPWPELDPYLGELLHICPVMAKKDLRC